MKSTVSTFIEWGAILVIAFFVVPRLLQAMGAANARTATQYSPAAAWNAQAARGINTAGSIGNTALARMLQQLLGQKPAGAASKGGSGLSGFNNGGAASMLPRPRLVAPAAPNLTNFFNAPAGVQALNREASAFNFNWTAPGAVEFNPSPDVASWFNTRDAADTIASQGRAFDFDWSNSIAPPAPDAFSLFNTSSPADWSNWDWSGLAVPPAPDLSTLSIADNYNFSDWTGAVLPPDAYDNSSYGNSGYYEGGDYWAYGEDSVVYEPSPYSDF